MYTIEALLESVMKSIILAPLFTLTQIACLHITASSFSSYPVAPYPEYQSFFFFPNFLFQTVSTVYFIILGTSRTDLWSQGSYYMDHR